MLRLSATCTADGNRVEEREKYDAMPYLDREIWGKLKHSFIITGFTYVVEYP